MGEKPWAGILKNTFFLVSGRTVTQALQFLMFIYAARALGAESFGRFSSIYTLVGICLVFMDLGVSRYFVQQGSRDPNRIGEFLGGVLQLKVVLIAFGWLVILVVGLWIKKQDQSLGLLLVLGGFATLDSLIQPFFSVFQAVEQMKLQARAIIIGNTIMVAIGFVLLTVCPSAMTLAFVFLVGAGLRLALSSFWAMRKFVKPVWGRSIGFLWDLLKNGFPFALVTIFITIYYYIDTLVLTAYASEAVVGYYNAAYRLIEGPLFLVSSLTLALFPAASKLFGQDLEELKKLTATAFKSATVIGLITALPVAFLAHALVPFLFGPEYGPAGRVLPILIFSLVVIMPNTILGNTIRAMDRQGVSAWVSGLGAVFNVVANLLVIPKYSFLGAAWTTVATEILILIVNYFLILRYLGSVINFGTLIRMAVLTTILTAVLWGFGWIGPVAQGAAYMAVMPLALTGLGFVRKSDLEPILHWYRSRHRPRA